MRTYPGVIQNVEIRVDGVCENCLKKTDLTPIDVLADAVDSCGCPYPYRGTGMKDHKEEN